MGHPKYGVPYARGQLLSSAQSSNFSEHFYVFHSLSYKLYDHI